MYSRSETIEEENLDWEMNPAAMLKNMDSKITKIAMPSMSKEKKMFFTNSIDLKGKFNLKKLTHFLDTNPELSLLFSMLAFPYIVGFFISYFLFHHYGGMSIESFLNIEKGNIHIEFWSIGAYLFITAGVIWAAIVP